MKLLKEWVIPTLIVLLLAGVVIAVAIPLVNASSDEDTFEERRGERDSFNGDREREDERGSFERDGGRGERDGFSLLGLMGGIVKQVVFMLVGGGITLGILALIRQFTHNNKPPQPETA